VPEEIVEIPLEKIIVLKWTIKREVVKDRSFEELKENMRINGLLQPIEVALLPSGYELVFDFRCYEAARELGWKTIMSSKGSWRRSPRTYTGYPTAAGRGPWR
jgi:ParB-like chromosome segregation protein Spo0J